VKRKWAAREGKAAEMPAEKAKKARKDAKPAKKRSREESA
jgi:hypothetical protein